MQLIAIIGPSGSGKDTVAYILSSITGYDILVSYTTRPMREGEQQGREHHFVTECDVPKEKILAYTEFGGYQYWTTVDQLRKPSIYVIDEEGLTTMMHRVPYLDIIPLHVSASKYVRRKRGVSEERMKRDDMREQFPLAFYKYRVYNNHGMDYLRGKLRTIADDILTHIDK